jgi:hypothetical protein
VLGAEEVPAVADLDVRAEGETLLVDRGRGELMQQQIEELAVGRELLEAGDQAALEPAGRLPAHVRAGEEGRLQGVHRLVARLVVRERARRERAAARTPRQSEPARDLPRGVHPECRLRAAERRRAGLHVRRREERADHARRAGSHELHERDAGERLDALLDERGRHRYGRHRAHEQERRHDHRLSRGRVVEDALEHPAVEAQWRVDVAVREQDRRLLDRLTAVEDDLGEAEAVSGRLRRGRLARPDAVRQPDRCEAAHQVPDVERHVVRLEDVPPRRVERVVEVRELEQ